MTRPVDSSNAPRRPLRVIAVTSGKGGVGKTNVVVNLGATLAARGHRVLILDGDLGLANVDILLDRVPRLTLDDVLAGRGTIEDVLLLAERNLSVLPAGNAGQGADGLSETERHRLLDSLEELGERFDTVIVDTAAGVGPNTMFFASAASDILVVATPEPTAIADAYAAVKLLSMRYGVKRVGLLANRVRTAAEADTLYQRLHSVVTRFLPVVMEYVGAIPEDQLLRDAVMRQSPVVSLYPDSTSAGALRRLAAGLESRPLRAESASRVQFFWNRVALGPSGIESEPAAVSPEYA